jgi:hypothetical protein
MWILPLKNAFSFESKTMFNFKEVTKPNLPPRTPSILNSQFSILHFPLNPHSPPYKTKPSPSHQYVASTPPIPLMEVVEFINTVFYHNVRDLYYRLKKEL